MNDTQVSAEVVEQLANTLKITINMLESMTRAHEGRATALGQLREDLIEVKKRIRRIAQVLHEGNGERPIVTRVAVLENGAEDLRKDFERFLVEYTERIHQQSVREGLAIQAKNIDKKGRWKVTAAVVSGIVALATSIISLLR